MMSHSAARSVQSFDWLGHVSLELGGGGVMLDNLAEIFFQYFLQEATVSSSGMSRDVHSLTMSIQHL